MSTELNNQTATREAIIARGQSLYEDVLKTELEREHFGRFVAIDPESGRYFLGDTSAEALGAAHDALPSSRFYLTRVGYKTAHTIGGHALRHRNR